MKKTKSKKNGEFSIMMKEGKYSLFVEYNENITCTWQECTPECICSPVKIIAKDTTYTELIVNMAQW